MQSIFYYTKYMCLCTYVEIVIHILHRYITHIQGRQSGLKRGGAQRGRAGNFGVYLAPKYELCKLCPELSGRGRKSGGARALLALPRMAPLVICEWPLMYLFICIHIKIKMYCQMWQKWQELYYSMYHPYYIFSYKIIRVFYKPPSSLR